MNDKAPMIPATTDSGGQPRMWLQFPITPDADGMDDAVALQKCWDARQQERLRAKGSPGKGGKGKPKAPAPKPEPADALDLSDVAGADDEDDETGGLGIADDIPGFTGTPAEAKEEALGRLRKLLAEDRKAEVKEVQLLMKVAKFHDVPEEQGYEFLKAVIAVEAKIKKGK